MNELIEWIKVEIDKASKEQIKQYNRCCSDGDKYGGLAHSRHITLCDVLVKLKELGLRP